MSQVLISDGRLLIFLVFFTFMDNSGSLFEFERKRGTKNYSLDFWIMEMRQKKHNITYTGIIRRVEFSRFSERYIAESERP